MVDLGMVGKVSSIAVDYEWNHNDPMARSPKILPKIYGPLNSLLLHR